VATGTVGADGKVTITLPSLGRGIHLITVHYEGSEQLTESTSSPKVLLVW
jgi:hypothetical protein